MRYYSIPNSISIIYTVDICKIFENNKEVYKSYS